MNELLDYLTVNDLTEIGLELIHGFTIRDFGALESSCLRPQVTVFGDDAYPDFPSKVAALMHAIARNHPLVDGNKRLAWAGSRAFCLINGYDIQLAVDEAEQIVVGTAAGTITIDELTEIMKSRIVVVGL
jgi:death-on-curing protein